MMKWQIYFSHLTERTNWTCNDEEEKSSEGENKGDKDDQFEANVNKSGHELGEGNDCVAEICGVDDCEGELEEKSKATFDINDEECNMITDTCWKKRYQQAQPPNLDWYLDVLVKHTTVDSASGCLSRRRIVKMIYFKL